jgi:hypothetical protein
MRWYTWWLAHLSKDGRSGEVAGTRQMLAHRTTDAGPCVCRLTLGGACWRGASDARTFTRQTLASVSVHGGVSSTWSERASVKRCVASVDDVTDASVGWAQCGVLCATSVAATDAGLGRDGRVWRWEFNHWRSGAQGHVSALCASDAGV